MKFLPVLLCLLLLIVNSSSSLIPVKGKGETIRINLDSSTVPFWTDLVEIVETVKLELTEKSIISGIYKVEFANNRFYVLDKQKANALFVYDRKGKFIQRIGRDGKGPGEHLRIEDFNINYDNKNIEILDIDLKKIMCFDFNGKFIKDIPIPIYGMSIINMGADSYGLYNVNIPQGDKRFNYYLINNKSKIIQTAFPYSKKIDHINKSIFFNFYRIGGQIALNMPFNDTIYNVSKGSFERKYIFNFGKYTLPANHMTKVNYKNLGPYMRATPYVFSKLAFETQSYVFASIRLRKDFYSALYSKKTKGYKLYNNRNLFDPLAYMEPIANMGEDKMICVGYPQKLTEQKVRFRFLNKNTDKKTSDYLTKTFNSIGEEDNPVLFIAKIKPF
jgi:hypothetical protein